MLQFVHHVKESNYNCRVNGEPTNGYTKNMMQLDLIFLKKSIYSNNVCSINFIIDLLVDF